MKNHKLNLLLLSGSKAAGSLPKGEKPGLFDWAEKWINAFFTEEATQGKPIMFVPYARAGGLSEADYFKSTQDRLQRMGIACVCAPKGGITEVDLFKVGGVFVGGGHTPTLLYKLQSTGALAVLREAASAGLPYMGSSAGTLITCPTIKTNNDMPGPANDVIDLISLGLIPFQLNCHYMDDSMHDPAHQGETRDLRLKEFCIFNPGKTVLGLYEGQAIRVQGDKAELWTSKNARGFNTPIFSDDRRIELACAVDEPCDISWLLDPRYTRNIV
ncbi:MAG: dipeptidase PepE [Gammaproteobacteria bacterium CG11_big_fil_rev_8_21_14_0_20_46_22]|nr:MAG: dipeptidase PepE [Gammaproteobacteria bacterium CG12_big_fil_rev_8_21_14_0_65_46_12]PIR10593.1 MAG: dipeptidase PepE [Gammaproteobacteria bacterium CG11_big_fil_rev_8_21_14_0_20_46_22]